MMEEKENGEGIYWKKVAGSLGVWHGSFHRKHFLIIELAKKGQRQ
jgi:hypothetical protein